MYNFQTQSNTSENSQDVHYNLFSRLGVSFWSISTLDKDLRVDYRLCDTNVKGNSTHTMLLGRCRSWMYGTRSREGNI